MPYAHYNPSPLGKRVGDCVIRAISKATDQDWESTYAGVCLKGFEMCDMPSSDAVWGAYLRDKGFRRYVVPDNYGEDYTVETFSLDHPEGTYILAIGGHVVCVVDSNYFDSWDSGQERPVYYWSKERL